MMNRQKILLKFHGSPADAEIDLEKAVDSIRLSREQNALPDAFLKGQKDIVDAYVSKIFEHMIQDIADVVTAGNG